MRKFAYLMWLPFLVGAALTIGACQSAETEDDESLDVDDFIDSTVTPNPVIAAESTDGRSYRIVRGNNQPDEILLFDWKASYAVTLSVNNNATDEDVDIEFPLEITAATVKVEQAAGGIIIPPTGGDVEHYDSVLAAATGNKFAAVGGAQTLSFEVWYDLPSLKKECVVTTTINFKDDNGMTFSKTVKANVAP